MLTEDWMMRQVEALARSIAYLVFRKDTTEYVPTGAEADETALKLCRKWAYMKKGVPDGKAKIKIEPGTQPGKVLRLRGKGLPNINSYGYSTGTGDLLVNVSVYIPETLTKEERQLLEKWQESESFRPNLSLKEKIFKKFRSLFD